MRRHVCQNIFGQDLGRGRLVQYVKFFSAILFDRRSNLVALCRTVWADVGFAKNWGLLEPNSLGTEIVSDPVETRPSPTHMLLCTEFGRRKSNGISVDKGSRNNLGTLGPCLLG